MAFELFTEGSITCKCGQVHRVVCEIERKDKSARIVSEAVEASVTKPDDKPKERSAWPYED